MGRLLTGGVDGCACERYKLGARDVKDYIPVDRSGFTSGIALDLNQNSRVQRVGIREGE